MLVWIPIATSDAPNKLVKGRLPPASAAVVGSSVVFRFAYFPQSARRLFRSPPKPMLLPGCKHTVYPAHSAPAKLGGLKESKRARGQTQGCRRRGTGSRFLCSLRSGWAA